MRRFRAVVFLAIAAHTLLGPAVRQAAGVEWRGAHAWRMFHRIGIGEFVAEFRHADGTVIDRAAVDGPGVQRAHSFHDVERHTSRLCRKLEERDGAKPDVRRTVRLATERGWNRVVEERENACR